MYIFSRGRKKCSIRDAAINVSYFSCFDKNKKKVGRCDTELLTCIQANMRNIKLYIYCELLVLLY